MSAEQYIKDCQKSVQERFNRIKNRFLKELPLTKKEIRFYRHYENSKFNKEA
jgi:hypothetical protein